MKLATYNIRYGLGKDNRYDHARIAREIEGAEQRVDKLTGFVDTWVAAGQRQHAGVTADNGKRIDYCFVTAALQGRVRTAQIDANATGYDHQPLWIEMDL